MNEMYDVMYDEIIVGAGGIGLSRDMVMAAATGVLADSGVTRNLRVDNYGH